MARLRGRRTLRHRVAAALVLIVALSTLLVAGGSWLVVRQARYEDSLRQSLERARLSLALAREQLSASPSPAQVDSLLAAYARRGGFATVVAAGERAYSSSISLGLRQVPLDLRRLVRRGSLAYERASAGGSHYLIVGGRPTSTRAELYLFFSEQGLRSDLRQLALILLAGCAAATLAAGAAGSLIARRALVPVARAEAAARALTDGVPATRLPVEGDDELASLARRFNEMAATLEAKLRELAVAAERERRFTADVSHELRTPLSALVTEADLLAQELERLPPPARRPAQLLVGDVERLRRLVEDLLEVSRLDAGAERLQLEPLDLRAFAESLLAANGWQEAVQLRARGRVSVVSDRRRLARVLVNLIENACRHGAPPVAVELGAEPRTVTIRVRDHGPGIPPADLPHVFDRFAKGDSSRSRGGSGLGLAIALGHARALGGTLAVESGEGGACFTLRLPTGVAQPLREGDGAVAPARDDETATTVTLGSEER